MNAAINQIASNNTSGAAEILRRAGEAFSLLRDHQTEQAQGSAEEAQQAIIEACIALVRAQPYMSPLLRLASIAISAARTATGAQEALRSAEDQALRFIESAERAARAAALHAASLISNGAAVLTHSRSSTVQAALVEARSSSRDFSVVVTESRPGQEGRVLAQALASQGIRVSLIADAAASLAMDHIDFVLLGADTITPGNLVNKIGTRMIALAARERGLPLYTVCDTSKFIDADYRWRPVRDEGSVNSLWPDAPRGVLVVNSYFEPTPLAEFTGIITEDGVLSSEEASRRAERASIDKPLLDALEKLR
ncbi:MAG: hypothetical protein AABN33_07505 [Acidobacteriota bacterium]